MIKIVITLLAIDNVSISNNLEILTRRPHIAGSEANNEAAAYVVSVLTSCNILCHVTSYDVALSYPFSRSLVLTKSSSEEPPISFNLSQKVYQGDPYADVADEVVPTFHAYAKSGDIVKNAYDEGAIGVVIYSDKKDYGGGDGEAKWFPDEKWLPPSGVQVGSVYGADGDPTTPGWASNGECERISMDEVEKRGDVPLIPSLPVSGEDAEKIIRSIGGPIAEDDWQGSKDAPTYRVGPGPGILNLSYTVTIGMHGYLEPLIPIVALQHYLRAVAYLNVDSAVGGPGFHAGATPQLEELIKRATQKVKDPDNSSQSIYDSWTSSSSSPQASI
ncbi:hypothetical protein TSUD_142150 [Trifolium subterraneum]|uniref:PA domain-containing protein n=1 Tax=Trifolium subterraneum TaxID=3900 RepID=A0A2Z6LV71_TRISU|nr:hypothetical protein TSUD_142150 [Trifolium subterraneum]